MKLLSPARVAELRRCSVRAVTLAISRGDLAAIPIECGKGRVVYAVTAAAAKAWSGPKKTGRKPKTSCE